MVVDRSFNSIISAWHFRNIPAGTTSIDLNTNEKLYKGNINVRSLLCLCTFAKEHPMFPAHYLCCLATDADILEERAPCGLMSLCLSLRKQCGTENLSTVSHNNISTTHVETATLMTDLQYILLFSSYLFVQNSNRSRLLGRPLQIFRLLKTQASIQNCYGI